MAIGGTIQTKVGIVEFRLTPRLDASDINYAGDSLCEDHSVLFIFEKEKRYRVSDKIFLTIDFTA